MAERINANAAYKNSPHFKTLREFLLLILGRHQNHGGVTEIRIIGKGRFKGIWVGYFTPDYIEALITAILPLPGGLRERLPYGEHPRIGEANVYFSLHPVDRALLARAAGCIERTETAATDNDVLVINLVAIDIDPVRKADISATDEEKEKARVVAEKIVAWFTQRGIAILLADSGNGFHILVLTISYADVESAAAKTKVLLSFLSKLFGSSDVLIDETVYNPSRIFKVYGTLAVKGSSIPERPHRYASIDLSRIPPDIDLFEALKDDLATSTGSETTDSAAPAKPAEVVPIQRGRAKKNAWSRDSAIAVIDELLKRKGFTFRTKDKGERYIFEFETCPHHTDHDGDHFECCLIVEANGQLSAKCQHDSSAGWQTLKTLIGWDENIAAVREALGIVTSGTGPRPAPETPHGLDLKIIDYVTNQEHVNVLFDRVLEVVRPKERFYNLAGEMVFVRPGYGLPRVRETRLNGYLGSFLEIAFYHETNDGGLAFQKFGLMPQTLIAAFASSPRMIAKLPVLHEYTRSPMFTADWHLIATPGFHAGPGVFYDGPAISPAEDTKRLDQVLGDFRWKTRADYVNTIGTLVTAVTMPHWIHGHPFLVVNGNRPGVGKTLLAKVLGAVVDGRAPRTVSFSTDDEEFEKQLATRVDTGDRFIIIDNAKGTRHVREVESQILERCVTDSVLNFRRLGGNTSIARPNDALFALTMNFTRLSRDLRRRNVPVSLEIDEDVRNVEYPHPDLLEIVLEQRNEIIAELLGLVVRYREAGAPSYADPAKHSTGQRWAATTDAILRFNGLDGFLDNFSDAELAFDVDFVALSEVCRHHRGEGVLSASEWASILVDGALEDRLKDHRRVPKTARAQATLVGQFFASQVNRRVDLGPDGKWGVVKEQPRGSSHETLYGFREIQP